VLTELYGGVLLQFAVSAAGVALLVGAAWMMDWFRRGDARAEPVTRRAVGADGEL
jgi:hypothetical protein